MKSAGMDRRVGKRVHEDERTDPARGEPSTYCIDTMPPME